MVNYRPVILIHNGQQFPAVEAFCRLSVGTQLRVVTNSFSAVIANRPCHHYPFAALPTLRDPYEKITVSIFLVSPADIDADPVASRHVQELMLSSSLFISYHQRRTLWYLLDGQQVGDSAATSGNISRQSWALQRGSFRSVDTVCKLWLFELGCLFIHAFEVLAQCSASIS